MQNQNLYNNNVNQNEFEEEFLDELENEEFRPIAENAMMLGDFIEEVHQELYADHRLSEVIELFATMTAVAKKFGDPFENEEAIAKSLINNYSEEEVNEFLDVMQSFQELGQEYGLTSLDGSAFTLQNVSDDLLEDLFAEAAVIAQEEEDEEGSFENEARPSFATSAV